jgi:hypothetical protein
MDTDTIGRTFLIHVAAAAAAVCTSPAIASSAVDVAIDVAVGVAVDVTVDVTAVTNAAGTLGVTVLGSAIGNCCCGGMGTMDSRDRLEKLVLSPIMDGSTDEPLERSITQGSDTFRSGGVLFRFQRLGWRCWSDRRNGA